MEEIAGWDVAPRRDGSNEAPRAGQPWTDAEYEQILAAAREGVTDIEEVAVRVGRGVQPTLAKARRLLPVAERSAPMDRVLPLVRSHQDDPEYDWQQVTLAERPPPPVIHPPAFTGIPGLRTDDLLAIGYAVGVAALVVDTEVVAEVGEELQRRGLLHELTDYRAERLLRRPGSELTSVDAMVEARSWVWRVFPATERAVYGWDHDGWEPY